MASARASKFASSKLPQESESVSVPESVSSNNGSGEDVTTVTFGGTRLDIVGLVQRSFLWSAFLVIRIIHIVEHLQYATTSTASGALTPKALVAVQV